MVLSTNIAVGNSSKNPESKDIYIYRERDTQIHRSIDISNDGSCWGFPLIFTKLLKTTLPLTSLLLPYFITS